MFTLLIILGALLIVMSIVLLLLSPIAGIAGIAFGALLIWHGINSKKKYKAGQLSPTPAAKVQQPAPAAAVRPAQAAAPEEPEEEPIELWIAGTSFRQDQLAALAKLLDMDPESDSADVDLEFVPEPDNEYDPNALKAIVTEEDREFFIGYCPKDQTGLVRKAMEANMTITGEISSDDGTYYASAYISK